MNERELRQRFDTLIDAQRNYLDVTVPERLRSNPSFDFKADPDYKRRAREIEDVSLQIRAGQFDRPASGAGREDTHGGFAGRVYVNEGEIRSFAQYLKTGQPSDLQQRALETTSGSIGGYLVPTGVSAQVIQDVAALESIRRGAVGAPGASVLPLDGPTNVPLINDASAVYYSETATSSGISDTAPTFGNIELRPQLLIARVPVKWHLLNRSAADLQQELVRSFTRGIAKAENTKFFLGTGTNEPQGITTVSPAVTAASATVFTAGEIDEVFYSLGTEYVNQSVWIVSPEAAALIRSLETTQGVPLYAPDRSDGLARMHGRPLIVDSYLSGLQADGVPVVLADLSQAYVIGEETALTVLADPYSRSSFAETVINVFKFNDGRIRKSAAVKSLKMASE